MKTPESHESKLENHSTHKAKKHKLDNIKPLYKALGHTFNNTHLIKEALTHSSVQATSDTKNYERLEFLGDRVLGLAVAHLLFERFPDEKEGELALRLSNLVKQETLAKVAKKLMLDRYLILARSERLSGGLHKPSVLADCCEAVIAALYLDGGLDKAQKCIERYWSEEFGSSAVIQKDSKSLLQEWTQAHNKPIPSYRVIAIEGQDHLPVFTIEVQVQGYRPLSAQGGSKKEAMQRVAELFLRELNSYESNEF